MPETRSSLITSLSADSPSADWHEFLHTYRPLVERTVLRCGIRGACLDDVVQEVLVQLLRSFPFPYQRERGKFRNWLQRVAVNKSRDRQRRRARAPGLIPDCGHVPDERRETTHDDFRKDLMRAALRHAERTCRPKAWRCFAAHAIEGKAAREVAALEGVSENAVFLHSSRVLAIARQFCRDHGEELSHVAS